jgi:hypothetical protein
MIVFDGDAKTITLTTDTTFIDKDIYDAAIDWAVTDTNMQYLLPMDFIAPNYRLLNGWQFVASGYAAGTLITITGSIVAVSGDRVASGSAVEWDIGTTINTIFISTGSGLSTAEHDQLFETLTEDNYLGLR